MGDTFEGNLRLGEARLSALIEQSPDGIFVADLAGRYVYVNEAGCRLLGYSRDEIVGKTIEDFIAAEESDRLARSKDEMLRGTSHVGEWKLRRKDGAWVPVEVNANILADGQWQGFVRDISDRKAREAQNEALFQQIDAERRWLQAVLDTVPVGVLLFEPGGRLFFNRRTEEMFGIRLCASGGNSQYLGRILFPDGNLVPQPQLVSERVLRNGETVLGADHLLEQPGGFRLPVIVSGAPIRDAQGRISGGIVVFQDVSERMRAEDAIRKSERLLNAIFDLLPVGVWITDAGGHIMRNNPAGERIWRGARHVGLIDYSQYKGWRVDTGQPIEPDNWALARAITKGETSIGEVVRIQCFDGSLKTIINSAAPLRDERGDIAGAIAVNEDITALHAAQEKLRASEQLFRTALDLLPVGLWIADAQGRITFANPAGQRIWGGTRYVGPEQYGEYKAWWTETGQPVAPEEWGLTRAVRKGETSSGELIRIQCFDGSFKTVINWAGPIRSDTGEITGGVAINEDVSALYQTQEQLRAAVRDREQILAVVSHDLRTPLNALMIGAAAVERLAAGLPGGKPVHALAASLMNITSRMSGLVDDLLAVAVAEKGRPMLNTGPMSGAKLLRLAANAARPLFARQGIVLETKTTGTLRAIPVDSSRILRVFANLLDNAMKFTEPSGRVVLAAEAQSDGVRFSVANSGAPLDAEHIDAMFQPFWQAERDDSRGTGLGLSICRSIVEAHGGSIWAEPAPGMRVRICFLVPRAGRRRKSGVAEPSGHPS